MFLFDLFQIGNSSRVIFFVAKHMLHLLVLMLWALKSYIETCLFVGQEYINIVQ